MSVLDRAVLAERTMTDTRIQGGAPTRNVRKTTRDMRDMRDSRSSQVL